MEFHPFGHVYLCVKVSVDCSDIKPTLNYIGAKSLFAFMPRNADGSLTARIEEGPKGIL